MCGTARLCNSVVSDQGYVHVYLPGRLYPSFLADNLPCLEMLCLCSQDPMTVLCTMTDLDCGDGHRRDPSAPVCQHLLFSTTTRDTAGLISLVYTLVSATYIGF